jgi:hypothetical protein
MKLSNLQLNESGTLNFADAKAFLSLVSDIADAHKLRNPAELALAQKRVKEGASYVPKALYMSLYLDEDVGGAIDALGQVIKNLERFEPRLDVLSHVVEKSVIDQVTSDIKRYQELENLLMLTEAFAACKFAVDNVELGDDHQKLWDILINRLERRAQEES